MCEQPSTFVVPRGIDVVAADPLIEWPALACIPEPAFELVGAHDALDRDRHGFDLWQARRRREAGFQLEQEAPVCHGLSIMSCRAPSMFRLLPLMD